MNYDIVRVVTPTLVPDGGLTDALAVRVAFKAWRANTTKSSGKVLAYGAASTRSARTLVVVVAANSWITLVARQAAALVSAIQISTNSTGTARVRVQALINVNALSNSIKFN
jgi:hypothetical protein